MALDKEFGEIPGTVVFDAEQARKGYWLNQFCMSLMKREPREVQGRRARLSGLPGDWGCQAATAACGSGSLAGWNLCPKPVPSVPL